jgi:signal transduction histidine kinase
VIPAADWLALAGVTAACAAVVVVVGWLLLHRLRGSLTAHLLTVSLAALGTVALAVLVTTRLMFLSEHDARVVLVVVILAVPAAAAVAVLLGVELRRASRELAGSAQQIGGEYRAAPEPPTTELREISAAMAEAHERLVAARTRETALEQGRRELVAWMGHDLRTPLAGIRAMAESLEDAVVTDPATVSRYHRQLRVEVDRMAGMVNDLFELCRVQGPLQLQLERVGAHDLVEEALASADPVARAKGVHLVATVGSGLPVAVDVTEFGRVLRNLLLNAIRHTPYDGTISVAAQPVGADVTLSVTDSCGGIPAADLDRVFQTAFRGEPARTTADDQGGGLGLAIARGIVEAHSGAITVVNHGPGCRFEVRLPLATS